MLLLFVDLRFPWVRLWSIIVFRKLRLLTRFEVTFECTLALFDALLFLLFGFDASLFLLLLSVSLLIRQLILKILAYVLEIGFRLLCHFIPPFLPDEPLFFGSVHDLIFVFDHVLTLFEVPHRFLHFFGLGYLALDSFDCLV